MDGPPPKRQRLSLPPHATQPSTSKRPLPSLLDLAAQVTAEHYPFQRIEERYSRIPEPVQRRILYWSFPREELHIRLYSSPCEVNEKTDLDSPSSYSEGLRLLEQECVEDALQIGFHLSGVVRSLSVIEGERKAFNVSLNFDRCKITAVKCSCDTRDIHWCQHVVALALHRIRNPDHVRLRLPISETLYHMDREQLQKLVQYLISEHHAEVLPTAQTLADEILKPQSDINSIRGAPDPTAGPCADGDHSWFLDEAQVCTLVRSYLSQNSAIDQLHSLFAKVREMLRRRDGNGPRLLQLLTEQFLAFPWLHSFRTNVSYQPPTMSEKVQQLWDTLGALWVSVVLNPYASATLRSRWQSQLQEWINSNSCPTENAGSGSFDAILPPSSSTSTQTRTVFHRAVDACHVQWNDAHLMAILNNRWPTGCGQRTKDGMPLFNKDGLPLWHEHVPTACARVQSLQAHGYTRQALSLGSAVVRHMKHWQKMHQSDKPINSLPPEGWMGHPLDPINSIYDTMMSSSDPKTRVLAVQSAIIGLGQRRRLASCSYARRKCIRHEQSLVAKLKTLPQDSHTAKVLGQQAQMLVQGGSWSCLCLIGHNEMSPMHSLAAFLFEYLLEEQPDLAYRVALSALRVSLRDELNNESSLLLSQHVPFNRTFTLLEDQLSELAQGLLVASKHDKSRLTKVLAEICEHVRSSSLIYRLAHALHREATSQAEGSNARQHLLNTALELGLQVLRMTVGSPSWWARREMVAWLVRCACSLGIDALLTILVGWHQLFTPLEAAGTVAQMIVTDSVILQLKLDLKQQEELSTALHRLALQCAHKNPAGCALHALTLCENSAVAFDEAYRIVVDAARTNCMPAQELFNIARHMEHRGNPLKAYELSVLGIQCTHIGHSDEASPLVQDVYWSCWLADRLGKYQLTTVIAAIVKNVKCPTVLSAILRGYALGASGLANLCSVDGRKGPKNMMAHTKLISLDEPPLNQVLDAAIAAYVNTAHSRLTHISPRHYGEFLDFLTKARDTFALAPEGQLHFNQLLENMKLVYKGKKKLIASITERFG